MDIATKQVILDVPQVGTDFMGKPETKPPFLPSRKRKTVSDSELESFYSALREYYLGLPYNNERIIRYEHNYQGIARIACVFTSMKGITVLHKDRLESSQAMIYTSNHVGSYDQFFVPAALGKTALHYLVKNKVSKWYVRWNLLYKPTGVVLVEPENMKSWNYAKAELMQYILHDSKVFIFAEGSRRGENNIGGFNPGIAQIAQEAGQNICTLAIKNTASLLSKNPVICVGETVTVSPREDIRAATERIKTGVVNAYNEILEYENEYRR